MCFADAERGIETLYALGLWLLEQGRALDAVHVFRSMLLACPTDERAWVGLGTCHEQLGATARALLLYELAAHAASPPCRSALARARLLRDTDADAASAAYDVAVAGASARGLDDLAQQIARERTELS